MTPNQIYNAYENIRVQSIDKLKLVVLLYEGAINFLNQAKKAMIEKNYAQKGKFIGKAEDIIIELCSSLDMEKGGEIAVNLSRLYDFMLYQLTMANLKNKSEYIDTVIDNLETLLKAWKEIEKKQKLNGKTEKKQSTTQGIPKVRIRPKINRPVNATAKSRIAVKI